MVCKRFTVYLLFLFLSNNILSQKTDLLDSMKLRLKTSSDTSVILNSLYTLSYEYGLIEPRRGLAYGMQCLNLAQLNHNVRYQLNAYNGMGNSYETMANFDSARWCHEQSYVIAKKLGVKNTIAATLFNIAGCYKEQGAYRNALNIYLKAFQLIENENEYNPRLHYYMGEMLLKIGNVQQAEYHARNGIKKCIQWKAYHVLPNLYINLAKCKLQQGKTDSAITILKNALSDHDPYFG